MTELVIFFWYFALFLVCCAGLFILGAALVSLCMLFMSKVIVPFLHRHVWKDDDY